MDCSAAYTKANEECDKMFNCAPSELMGSLCIACVKVTPIFLGISACCFQSPCLGKMAIKGCIATQLPILALCTAHSTNEVAAKLTLKTSKSQFIEVMEDRM